MSRDFQRFPVPALHSVAEQVGANPLAHIYFPRNAGKKIVCATATPTKGMYIELEPKVMPSDVAPEHLGQAVWEALLSFRRWPVLDQSSLKKTAWPAYRASGAKSVRAFEEEFTCVSVEAFPCVLRVQCEVPVKAAQGLFVGRYITNACEFDELGVSIGLVCRCSLQIRLE